MSPGGAVMIKMVNINVDGYGHAGPFQDQSGSAFCVWAFGNAHACGFNVAFCDGSVRSINYAIDLRNVPPPRQSRRWTVIDAIKFRPHPPYPALHYPPQSPFLH